MENELGQTAIVDALLKQASAELHDLFWHLSTTQQTLRELRWRVDLLRAERDARAYDSALLRGPNDFGPDGE